MIIRFWLATMGDVTRNIAKSLVVRSVEHTHSEPTFRCSAAPPFRQFHNTKCRLTSDKVIGIVLTFLRWAFVLDHRAFVLDHRVFVLDHRVFVLDHGVFVLDQWVFVLDHRVFMVTRSRCGDGVSVVMTVPHRVELI